MADNKYSVRLRQAYAGINVLKPAIQKLARDGKTNTQAYKNLVKQLQAAQAEYDKLKRAEERFLAEEESTNKKEDAAPKQGDLDVANATGNTAEAQRIAKEMQDAGVTPLGLDGKPMKGFEPKEEKPGVGKSKVPTESVDYTIDKDGNILDPKGKKANGTYIWVDPKDKKTKEYVLENGIIKTGTTYKVYNPDGTFKTYDPITNKETKEASSAASPATGTSNKTGGTGGTGSGSQTPGADKIKTAWLGYLESTFKTLPKEYKGDIDKLLATAKTEGWQEGTFTEALKQTKWWQETLPSLRSFFIETHDPRNAATFAEKMGIQTANVAASLEKLGIRAQQVDPVTGKVVDNAATIQGIAMEAVKNGWTEVQTLQHLGDNAQLLFTGGGTIGSSVDNIKKQALNYGINIDKNYLDTIQRSLLDPTDGRDTQYYLNEMKAQAMDLYKPFASSIKEGRSLYEVTNSYRNQMATLLEVDSTNLTWKDLMAKVVDPTTGNARTFADFNKQVKQDPLWQYTKNAKETYSNTALDLMKQFGFMG